MQPLTRATTGAFGAITVLGVLSATAAAGAPLADPGPISLAGALFGLLFLQRRYPLSALALAAATIAALRISHLTDAGWLWPATLLYVQAALARRTTTVVAAVILHALIAFNLDWTVLGHTARAAMSGVATDALWVSAAIGFTVSYRNWRNLQAESLQRLRTELDEQRTAERLRLAQEVHDAVAHTLAVVGVHVNVAADALDSDPDEARAALRLAQDIRRRAMADLSALVGVLRTTGDGVAPPVAPPALEDLVAGVRAAGLDAALHVDGDEDQVPLPVRLVAAAVVREALTNVVKHAGARHATVRVHYGPSTEVTVADDGAGAGAGPTGHGLRGLAERVTALGGSFSAGSPHGDSSGTGAPHGDSSGTGAPHGDSSGTGALHGDSSGTGAPHGDSSGTGAPPGDSSGVGAPPGGSFSAGSPPGDSSGTGTPPGGSSGVGAPPGGSFGAGAGDGGFVVHAKIPA
ncbi:histidine kinase [Dactylosporangium sp. McL0621]|uniref:sensor histidine kinase n=1 Tax=Dactylosporangium sp. McL0621 TaxID=3415678 RepID=UPI003CEDE48C